MGTLHRSHTHEEIHALLLKRIEAFKKGFRQNIALVGYKSVGKTTTIFSLLHRLKSSSIVPIYIRLKPKSIDSFVRHFIGVLLFQCMRSADQPLEDNLNFLLEQSQPVMPQTCQSIQNILKGLQARVSPDELFGQVMHLPQLVYDELKKPVLLIFDEFHNFEKIGVERPFLELSNRIMVQKFTMHLLVSSAVSISREILSKKLTLLFGNFEILNMEPMSAESSAAFIAEHLEAVSVDARFQRLFIEIGGGFPFYLDALSSQLKQQCAQSGASGVTQQQVLPCLSQTLWREHGVLNQYFTAKLDGLAVNGSADAVRDVLTSLAEAPLKINELAKKTNRKKNELSRIICRLQQTDVLVKRGVYYIFTDRLFRFWLKFVLRNRHNSFNIDSYDPTAGFEQTMKNFVRTFFQETEKPAAERLQSLLRLFANEIIELNSKRFMLPSFDRVEVAYRSAAETVLCAVHNQKSWCFYVTERLLDDNALGTFLEVLQRTDCVKKILIALNGIDENARLKAMEEKLWIWDEQVINELFRIFNRPLYLRMNQL